MISSRKAEFTFCQMISTQWKRIGQKPGVSVLSGEKPQSVHSTVYSRISTIRNWMKDRILKDDIKRQDAWMKHIAYTFQRYVRSVL